MATKINIKDRIKPQGAAVFTQEEKQVEPNTNTATTTKPDIKSSNNTKPKNNSSTKRSTKPSNNTNTVIIKEKVKYVDTKTQRAYWFDNELIEVFAAEYPKEKYDNSAIMNQLLRNFLIENGKI